MEREKKSVNNAFYDELGQDWTNRFDHPIALLRAENKLRNPWIHQALSLRLEAKASVLDIGCGGGLLTSFLSSHGHHVTGIDLSEGSINFAKALDPEALINYQVGDAHNLPFEDQSFDAVCMMDVLEHVGCFKTALKEAVRVLKKDGLLFFHTFNRSIFSYILVIKGVEWFVKNTPKDIHVYRFFIKPKELTRELESLGMQIESLFGLVPDFKSKGFKDLLFKKTITQDFEFKFSKSLKTGYIGFARKL